MLAAVATLIVLTLTGTVIQARALARDRDFVAASERHQNLINAFRN
jgi:hypothetical protein